MSRWRVVERSTQMTVGYIESDSRPEGSWSFVFGGKTYNLLPPTRWGQFMQNVGLAEDNIVEVIYYDNREAFDSRTPYGNEEDYEGHGTR